MPRLHLFEFEDQPWCPRVLRNAVTAYIDVVARMTRQLDPVVPAVEDLLERSGETGILDLCSGSGGNARALARALAQRGRGVPVVRTDLFPDLGALAAGDDPDLQVTHRREPLDATAVPASMPGLRTIFNAFHHLRPDDARRLLRSAADARRPVVVVEFVDRSPMTLFGVLFSPLLSLFVLPFTRPFRWTNLLLTWGIPVIPAMIFWDGLVSWLRVYSVRDLEELGRSVGGPDYRWTAGKWRAGLASVTWLVGEPA